MTERDKKYEAFVKDDKTNNRGQLVNCCKEIHYLLEHPQEAAIFTRHYLNDILTYAVTFF